MLNSFGRDIKVDKYLTYVHESIPWDNLSIVSNNHMNKVTYIVLSK